MVALRSLVLVIGLLAPHVTAQDSTSTDIQSTADGRASGSSAPGDPAGVSPAATNTAESAADALPSEASSTSTTTTGELGTGSSGLGGTTSPQPTSTQEATNTSGTELRTSASASPAISQGSSSANSVTSTSTPSESAPNSITTNYTLKPGSPMFPEGWKVSAPRLPKRQNDAAATPEVAIPNVDLPTSSMIGSGGGLGNNTATSSSKPQPLMFLGSKITVKGTPPSNSTSVVWTLDNNRDPSNGRTMGPGVVFQGSGLEEGKVHTLAFESQQPLDITEIDIELRAQVSGGLNQESFDQAACQTIPLVDGNKVTTDGRFKLSGASVKGEVVETTESLQIMPSEGTILVKVLGAVDPAYGTYTAYLEGDPDKTVKGVASAQNAGEKDALYWLSSTGSKQNIRLDAMGTIGLRSVQFCYSSKELKDKAASSTGGGKSKSNVGPIVGGVVGGIAALAIIALLLYCCKKKRTRQNATYHTVTAFHGGGSAEASGDMKQVNHSNNDLAAVSTAENQLARAPPSSGITAPLLGVSHMASRGQAQRLSTGPSDKPAGGDGDGDALPVYNHGWTSTATGDVKRLPKVRGFVARRASQSSLATTISTVDDHDDGDSNLHPNTAVGSGTERAVRATSSSSRRK